MDGTTGMGKFSLLVVALGNSLKLIHQYCFKKAERWQPYFLLISQTAAVISISLENVSFNKLFILAFSL
jgi:hypothetical protein